MHSENNSKKKVTQLSDIARDLGLSTSTVSRVISGKGNISDDTRKRVKQYIELHNYCPNSIARSLAKSKTDNIAVVLPADVFSNEVPFFQSCLLGVCEAAEKHDYDVLVTSVRGDNLDGLKRIIENRKVDGILLTRSLKKDYTAEYLKREKVPFVVVGTTEDDIYQVDTDNYAAAVELTQAVKNGRKMGLLLGNTDYLVNKARYAGFAKIAGDGAPVEADLYAPDAISDAVDRLLESGCGCIVCSDDYICGAALLCLERKGLKVPDNVTLASLHNSTQLKSHSSHISAVNIDVRALGNRAGEVLIDVIEGKQPEKKILLGYEISI